MDGTTEAGRDDWDIFGRPLFNDPKARALSRVGVVDIGSNSVRLVVFDGAARSPAYFFNEKIMCALGAGLLETGHLSPAGKERARAALKRFKLLADGMGLPSLAVVATAAMREARDGPEFAREITAETGLEINVVEGEEEARLSAQGVLLGWPGSYGLVCDIGGSSMELATIKGGHVGKCVTSPLGPLKLADLDSPKARDKHIRKTLKSMARRIGPQRDRLFLVGGSWRAFARIDMHRRGYPLRVLHEYRMTAEAVTATAELIRDSDIEDLRLACGLSSSRMALVPLASEVLTRLIETVEPHDIAVSSYGIREGLLYEQMPQDLRDRDPLIEACRFAENKDARLPGFGRQLYRFVRPLFDHADATRIRLVKAACLLHDVSWRAHPDYRAEMCFDNATRANLGGLKHSERVFLGMALMHRYRNKRTGTRFDHLYDLLDEATQSEAEVLGKAMRLGAMLWMSKSVAKGAALRWNSAAAQLTMHMTPENSGLFGEVAEARLQSLAGSLGGTASMQVGELPVD